jgi:hypothetical protein
MVLVVKGVNSILSIRRCLLGSFLKATTIETSALCKSFLDAHHIREKSRKYIETNVTKNIPFEFNRYLAGLDQITKKLWEMTTEDKGGDQTTTTTTTITNKDIMAVLTLLMQCYNTRLEILVGAPESNMNAEKHINDIKQKERIQNDTSLNQ